MAGLSQVGPATLTHAAAVDCAAELVPFLRERAQAAEARRTIPTETVQALTRAGLLRIATPERFGGTGLDAATTFAVAAELARGCGATGWCYGVWLIHSWMLGHWPAQAQEEYWAAGPDVLSSSSFMLGGAASTADGGYRLSGRWEFSSGCDAAAWMIVGAVTDSGPAMLLVPREDVTIVDTWHVSGLCGTGSKDLRIDNAFVPAHRAVLFSLLREADTDGWTLHGLTGYRLPVFTVLGFPIAAPLLGIGQAAVDAFEVQLRARLERLEPGQESRLIAAELRLAESAAEVDAARALFFGGVRELWTGAEAGSPVSIEDRARYRRDHGFAAKLCVRAVDRLFEASGGHALHNEVAMQRHQRDAQAAAHHFFNSWDVLAEQYGRVRLGLKPIAPL